MLIGHDDAWRGWRTAIVSARMHHAWILAGKQGLGKGAFALEAAGMLVAEAGIPQPAVGAHPDIVLLAPLPANEEEEKKRSEGKPYQTKRNITIDQIRRMQQRLTTRPTLGSRRVVVIDPADDMEKGAVNALLKSLEEPPAGTFFLLVTHRPGRMLPTVRSRCRMLRFPPLDDEQIASILAREAPQTDDATRQAAMAAAEGSPGSALRFVEQNLSRLHETMRKLMRDGDTAFAVRGTLAEEIGPRPDRDRMQATLELARAILSGELAAASRERRGRIIEAHAELTRLAAQAPTYNFDPGLLAMEIGGLLASAATLREATSSP